MQRSNRSGFSLIELMIVVAIVAIFASVVIPRLMAARLAANESATVSTLRSLFSAQKHIQHLGAIDTDGNEVGEYAYFGELSSGTALRICTDGIPAHGDPEMDLLTPPILSHAFKHVNAYGQIKRSGYLYQIWLPANTRGAIHGIKEGSKTLPDPSNGALLWCAYAWPEKARQTGNKAFFISQEGDILEISNRNMGRFYSGPDRAPEFDAAYSVADDMGSFSGDGRAQDGNVWTAIE